MRVTILTVVGFLAVLQQPELEAEYKKQEKVLLAKLQNEEIWNDSKQSAELERLLQIAGVIKPAELAPVLVKHIDYFHSQGIRRFIKPGPIELIYPSYGILVRLGLPSVQPLLNELKRDSGERAKQLLSQKRNLIVHCIIEIYDEGGYGRELARRRIELELKHASKMEQEALLEALEHPGLNE